MGLIVMDNTRNSAMFDALPRVDEGELPRACFPHLPPDVPPPSLSVRFPPVCVCVSVCVCVCVCVCVYIYKYYI